jgi:hypothetical protein
MKRLLLAAALAVAATGCSSPVLRKAEGLEVAGKLTPVPKGVSVYQYVDQRFDFSPLRRVLLEPVVVYSAPDHGFGDIPQAEREALARFIDANAPRILGGGAVKLAQAPAPDVVRLRLTLVGMTRSRPVLQGVSYAIPVGAALNLAKGAAGGSGVFMGSVTLAGEFYDTSTGALTAGFLAQRSPNAVNLLAIAGESAAAEQGALSLLEELRGRFDARAAERR